MPFRAQPGLLLGLGDQILVEPSSARARGGAAPRASTLVADDVCSGGGRRPSQALAVPIRAMRRDIEPPATQWQSMDPGWVGIRRAFSASAWGWTELYRACSRRRGVVHRRHPDPIPGQRARLQPVAMDAALITPDLNRQHQSPATSTWTIALVDVAGTGSR